ncbi:MAG: hypothetical protein ACE5EL_07445, partial [Anaerolineae bacterium]
MPPPRGLRWRGRRSPRLPSGHPRRPIETPAGPRDRRRRYGPLEAAWYPRGVRTDALDYGLTTNRIAQRPASPRDAARMMV